MDWFAKAMTATIMIGFGLLGFYVGLLVIKIAIDVAGVMLGSSVGTLLLAWILYKLYKANKDKIDNIFN